ncbi:MAG: ThuA domain-containing protein [Sphingomonadales bacterium]|nr:ThuA domain-containing protein [Sphingomonadales bacterium]
MFSALFPAMGAQARQAKAETKQQAVLIFSHTTGFRHKSVETGVAAVAEMVRAKAMLPVASEDISIFTKGNLSAYRAIIFVSNTTNPKEEASDWLTGDAAANFKAWLGKGGSVVGIHAASDSHYFQPWYGK